MRRFAAEVIPKRLKISNRVFRMVDWELHCEVLSKIERSSRLVLLKMIWGELPCMVKLKRDKRRGCVKCPLCGERDDAWHFPKCRVLMREPGATRIMGNLGSKLRKRRTSPILAM